MFMFQKTEPRLFGDNFDYLEWTNESVNGYFTVTTANFHVFSYSLPPLMTLYTAKKRISKYDDIITIFQS